MKSLSYNYSQCLSYPVVCNITSAMENAYRMAKVFNGIEEYYGKNINVWTRGSSGIILGTLFVSSLENKSCAIVCHVKKPGEISHWDGTDCHKNCEWSQGEGPFINIIIDDFISTGNTITEIHKVMLNESKRNVDVVCLTSTDDHEPHLFTSLFDHIPEYLIHRYQKYY